MPKTVAELVGRGHGPGRDRVAEGRLRRGGRGQGGVPRRARAGGVGAPHRRRRPGAAGDPRVRRRPREPQAQAGARPGRSRDRVLPLRASAPPWPAPPSRTWASRTSPTSRAASPPGRRPACPPPSTTTGSERARPPTKRSNPTGKERGPTMAETERRPAPRCRWTGTRSGSPTARWCPPTTWTRSSAGAARSSRRSASSTPTSATPPRTTGTRTTSTTSTTSSASAASTRRSHVNADIRRTVLLGRDVGLRGRLHAGARPRRHLPDGGPQGQEGRPHQEPQHHQERLVAHPGAHGHRACSRSTA